MLTKANCDLPDLPAPKVRWPIGTRLFVPLFTVPCSDFNIGLAQKDTQLAGLIPVFKSRDDALTDLPQTDIDEVDSKDEHHYVARVFCDWNELPARASRFMLVYLRLDDLRAKWPCAIYKIVTPHWTHLAYKGGTMFYALPDPYLPKVVLDGLIERSGFLVN